MGWMPPGPCRSPPFPTSPPARWRTTIRIPNPTRLFQEVRVETYLPSGQPMEAGFGGRRGTSRTYEVPPLGVLDVELSGAEAPVDGYAMLLFLSGATLPHTALYFHDGILQGTTGKAAARSISPITSSSTTRRAG